MFLHFIHALCKKIKSSAFSGNNLFRSLAIVSPAVENKCSTGADATEIHKIFFAISASMGNLVNLWENHCNGLGKIGLPLGCITPGTIQFNFLYAQYCDISASILC